MALDRLLVGDDGSGDSRAARRWAEAVAAASGAQVSTVQVVDDSASAGPAEAGLGDIVVRRAAGAPTPALLAAADEVRADIIVVGRRGVGGFSGLPLGSTAHQVAEHSGRPVAIVPPSHEQTSRDWPFTVIGVGHDGSPAGEEALSWAASVAAMSAAAVVVVHAVEFGPSFVAAGLDEAYAAARARLAATVEGEWSAPLRAAGIEYSTVVEDGGAAATLLAATSSAGVDLLVVGRQPSSSFPGLAMGSVAHRAVAFAQCPTVVVPRSG